MHFSNVRLLVSHFSIVKRSCDLCRHFSSKNNFNYHLRYLQMLRANQKLKKQKNFGVPSNASLQIIGCSGPGNSRSLCLITTGTNYLFNCGEGTQRIAFEYHHRINKVSHVFVTSSIWENIGGLPGLALTVEKNGRQELLLQGPSGVSDIMEALKKFIVLKDLTVYNLPVSNENVFEDNAIRIQCVTLRGMQEKDNYVQNFLEHMSDNILVDNTDYYAYEYKQSGFKNAKEKRNQANIKLDFMKGRIVDSMAYICKLNDKPGALDLDKCLEKGIQPGPDLGKLKNGQDVTLADGTVVRGDDVCSPPSAGPTFIVLECNNETILESLLESKAFDRYFEMNSALEALLETDDSSEEFKKRCDKLKSEIPVYVVHFTPERILKNKEYQDWMQKFGPTTEHILLNENNASFSSEGIYKMQHQLNMIHPTIFPPLRENTWIEEMEKEHALEIEKAKEERNLTVYRPQNQHRLDLRPLDPVTGRPIYQKDLSVHITPKEYIDHVFKIKGFSECLEKVKTEIDIKTKALGQIEEYPKVVMFGTGSMIPSKTRNTSGILLRTGKDQSILFDCSEGTIHQIYRLYGKTEAEHILKSIKVIYISHLHADHHLGLVGVLKARQQVTDEKLFLFGPAQLSAWLRMYHLRFDSILKTVMAVSNQSMMMGVHSLPKNLENTIYDSVGLTDISTVLVRHCPHAFGIAVTLPDGRKVVYSGDTMPCDELVNLGYKCHLLIHEATHEDEMITQARLKRHSTISQAIEMGHKMKAAHTLLTHFSQRYAKLPRLPDCDKELKSVGIAYDNMEIRFSDLPLLDLFYPALRLMFSEYIIEMDKKALKKQMREDEMEMMISL